MTALYTYDNNGKAIGVFIPIGERKKITKTYKELVIEEQEYLVASKNEILKSISEGIQQAKLHQQGKIKLKSAQHLLDEV